MALSTFAAVVALYCVVRGSAAPTEAMPSDADPGLIDGRLWVDSKPDKLTDYVQAAVFVGAVNLGLFERASAFDVHFELFDMTRDAKAIRLTFPQTKRSANFRYSVRECREKKPFDLCLDISSNPWGGPTRYYGFSKPDDEDHAFGALSARMRAAVAGATGREQR